MPATPKVPFLQSPGGPEWRVLRGVLVEFQVEAVGSSTPRVLGFKNVDVDGVAIGRVSGSACFLA